MKQLVQKFRKMGYIGQLNFWLNKSVEIVELTEEDIYLNSWGHFVIKYDTEGTKMHPLVYIDSIINSADLWLSLPYESVDQWLMRVSDIKFFNWGRTTHYRSFDMVLVRQPLFGNINKLRTIPGPTPPVKIPYEINNLIKYLKKEWMRQSLEGRG